MKEMVLKRGEREVGEGGDRWEEGRKSLRMERAVTHSHVLAGAGWSARVGRRASCAADMRCVRAWDVLPSM